MATKNTKTEAAKPAAAKPEPAATDEAATIQPDASTEPDAPMPEPTDEAAAQEPETTDEAEATDEVDDGEPEGVRVGDLTAVVPADEAAPSAPALHARIVKAAETNRSWSLNRVESLLGELKGALGPVLDDVDGGLRAELESLRDFL